ncbi:sugar phosphate exchanger 3 [Trichonephila inaurata madagascariensis]|uniref:Sugar phosphate exchanger 3 n=1 Tax=Trichonephila inaurata madagascariensis TaxID=2747483 RepID=A0A8X6WXV1_9ARAC|nr:sugar phosphate exchanger 3 [Trichonephila inaurata madagascariensis]
MASRRSVFRSDNDDEAPLENEDTFKFLKKHPQKSKYHVLAFVLTFFSYALFHATRKTFSNVKVTVSATWTPMNTSLPSVFDDNWNGHNLFKSPSDTSVFLGVLDTVFMVSYASGLFISGAIGDRLNLKYVLAFGMCSSSLTVFMFGVVSEWLHLYNKMWYVVFWSLTGLLQSTGWPTVVAVIGNWFGKSSRGFVMGVWGASPCVGNIVGTCIVNAVLHYGYQYSFLVTSCVTFGFGIVILFSLIPSPRDVGLLGPDELYSSSARTSLSPDEEPLLGEEKTRSIESTVSVRPKAVGLCHACCLPGVVAYSFAYACLKFVNYSFFFWLPFYLQMAYGWKEDKADLLSVWYDVGGIIGGILIGYLSDKLESRSPVVGLMLALSPFSLYIYSEAPADLTKNAALMTFTGIVIGGVASLISTAVSADLGRHPELANSKEALSTVTGIIDGTGSFGAAFGQILVPIIMKAFGWKSVFYVFMLMTILTLLCIIQIVYRDTVSLLLRLFRRIFTVNATDGLINAEREITSLN